MNYCVEKKTIHRILSIVNTGIRKIQEKTKNRNKKKKSWNFGIGSLYKRYPYKFQCFTKVSRNPPASYIRRNKNKTENFEMK